MSIDLEVRNSLSGNLVFAWKVNLCLDLSVQHVTVIRNQITFLDLKAMLLNIYIILFNSRNVIGRCVSGVGNK